jgi:FKBP-type peptidyl-prolyl cis-trans isomerase SlyD
MDSIQKNAVANFHYSLKDTAGNAIENNHHQEKGQVYLHGYKHLVSGLETAMEGKKSGDEFEVTVAPEFGYGVRDESKTQRVPIKKLGKIGKVNVGQWVQVQTDAGASIAVVKKVGLTVVDLDLNHPLSGKALVFTIKVLGVRAATAEEIEHGHVHGEGGVQH